MKKQQEAPSSQQTQDVLDLIDNTNKKYVIGRQDFILLIKKQNDKGYCTLYVTDCESKFWIKKIGKVFLQQLKKNMSINTELSVFCTHLIKNLKEKSKLKIQDNEIIVEIELVIGEGLVMTCSFEVQSCIKSDQDSHNYKMIMKLFMKQLFEAKQSQIDQQRKKWQKYRQEQEQKKFQKHEKVDPTYVKQVLNGNLKRPDILDPKMKNRSLMNPNQKKRKAGRIKFAGEEQG